LPYKRDTLGIFQFPWGEKSDSAVYDPIPVPNRASLGTFALNSTSGSRQAQPDPEPTEYSSSFFDDYEEDYEGESEVNSDDDFDESTLWEIATLLNSQDVPSRNSLFSYPKIIEDYDDEDDSEPDVTESISNPNQSTRASALPTMIKFLPIKPLKPLPPLPAPQENDDCEQTHATAERNVQQAAVPVWQAYLPALDDAVRGEPFEAVGQDSGSRPKAVIRVLWDKAIGAASSLPIEKAVALWAQQSSGTAEKPSPTPGHQTLEKSHAKLWTARERKVAQQVGGLFISGVQREDYRTSRQEPAALAMVRMPRIDVTPLMALSTRQLWSPNMESSSECHWITISSVRAPSPSLYSPSLSGRSSSSSDEASVTSAVTSASSVAGSNQESPSSLAEELIWRRANATSTSVSSTKDEGKPAAGNEPFSRPASSRGSRVLASRDLWESRAPVTDNTFNQKTWRSSKIIVPDAFQETKQKAGSTSVNIGRNVASKEPTSAAIKYDPAMRHPVFFASKMVSSAAFVHPAATGYVMQSTTSSIEAQKTSQLWIPSSPTASHAPRCVSLWTKPVSAKDNSNLTVQPAKDTPARKRTKNLQPLIQPVVSTTSLWRLETSSSSSSQHWLHSTALYTAPATATTIEQPPVPVRSETVREVSALPTPSRSSTWTAPKRSNTISGSQGNGLWVPAERKGQAREKSAAMLDVPSKRQTSNRHSSWRAEVETVESTELWRPKWGLPDSPKDWLRSRRATKVDFRW
jgi:hypothetical protein